METVLKGKAHEFQGLDEFQNDLLLVAQKEIPREMQKIMKKISNRGVTWAKRYSRAVLTERTGNYHKGLKSGKVFKSVDGTIVGRVLNTAPHGHLIEMGHHIRSVKGGPSLGFVPGKFIVEKAAKKLEESGDFETMLSRGLDDLLKKHKL